MRRLILWGGAVVTVGAVVLAALIIPPVGDAPWQNSATPPPSGTPPRVQPSLTPEPATYVTVTPGPSPTPGPERFNWLILGGDMGPGRPRADAGAAGDKTDVILLVSLLDTEPADVTIVQFPRNLYSRAYIPDRFLFEVYWQDGFEGMRDYFWQVFGIELNGIAYVDMTHFVRYIDLIGGVDVDDEGHMSGADLLAWLRDDENNWQHGVYDAGMRQHRALIAILDKVYRQFDGADFAGLFDLFSGVETDLSVVGFVDAAFIAYRTVQRGVIISFNRLAYPTIQRGDVPLTPGRGEVAVFDLKDWMARTLSP